jgi:small multidrug resistance pump
MSLPSHSGFALLVAVFLSALGVAGDCVLKWASHERHPVRNAWFFCGAAIFALSAFGWVYVFKYLKLSTVGVVYSLSSVLLLTLAGIVVFRESLSRQEVLGVVLAVVSIVLLSRHQ